MTRFAVGVALLILGYTAIYAGILNLGNGGKGPGFFQSLGLTKTLTGPTGLTGPIGGAGAALGNTLPNLTGQTPQTNGADTGPVLV